MGEEIKMDCVFEVYKMRGGSEGKVGPWEYITRFPDQIQRTAAHEIFTGLPKGTFVVL